MTKYFSDTFVDYSKTHPDHVYEEIEISDMSKWVQQQFARIATKDSLDAWADQGPERWESRLFGRDFARFRKEFLKQMKILNLSIDHKVDNVRRWELALFDSVTRTEVVMGNTFVEVPKGLILNPGRRGFFSVDCGFFDENDTPSRYAGVGRESLTFHKLNMLVWNGDVTSDSSILAVRGKIDGSRFVKVTIGKKTYLSGFQDIEVPANFPVEVAEYHSGKFYIVYPYGRNLKRWDIYDFVEHPWILASDYVSTPNTDGLMLLTMKGEIRVKSAMMVDAQVSGGKAFGVPVSVSDGVWEFQMVIDDTRTHYFPIRPRPGKEPKKSVRHLYSEVLSVHLALPSTVDHRLMIVGAGTYSGPITTRKNTVVIDSGCRMVDGPVSWVPIDQTLGEVLLPSAGRFDIEDFVEAGGIYYYRVRDRVSHEKLVVKTLSKVSHSWTSIEDLPDNVIGAKIVFPLEEDGSVFFFQDEADGSRDKLKPWDWPGGKSEWGETPEETARREVKEELDIDDVGPLFPLGWSTAWEPSNSRRGARKGFSSFIFLALPVKRERFRRYRGSYIPWGSDAPIGSQPWSARLCAFVWGHVPSVRALKVVHAYMTSTPMVVTGLTSVDLNSEKIRQLETFVTQATSLSYVEDIIVSVVKSHGTVPTDYILEIGKATGKDFRRPLVDLLCKGLVKSNGGHLSCAVVEDRAMVSNPVDVGSGVSG